MPPAGRLARSTALFCRLTRPAICGGEVLQPASPQAGGVPAGTGLLASGAPMVLNSGPAVAVEEFAAIVLLTILMLSASRSEMPAPSQPATLSAMMLLVTCGEYQRLGLFGKVST